MAKKKPKIPAVAKAGLAESLAKSKKFKSTVTQGDNPFWDTPMLACGLGPLDNILGGGFGIGRLGEIYGNFSSGKSYILYLYLIACQKKGGTAVLIETEGAFNPEWFAQLGGDPSTLVLPKCDTVEEVFTCLIEIAEYGKKMKVDHPDHVMCVGWDGIAATATEHLMKVGMDKRDMSKSGAMSQGTEYVTQAIKGTNVCVLATNQVREKIGGNPYDPTHTPGGYAWPFHTSQRLELRFSGGWIKGLVVDPNGKAVEGDEPIGRWVKAIVTKNKLAPAQLYCKLPHYTRVGEMHPVYKYPVSVGADYNESLFEYFYNGSFRLPPKDGQNVWDSDKVLTMPSSGWYALDSSIDPESKSFRKADWPAKIAEFPQILELCYA